ncbi:hypothetical protein [Paraflavitalea sp. CAU 1676]|uniref:hypothetical protein n=1 Tax=Paraflavitalea sp. CAU 1676 TaxID=3032598 RepID=UPI0023DBB7E9|nr:hypothetical protein [Paraflavitalea sp. CAU 1676]MDF2188312.1 hypothetical protein [Paraflavitalea sp. CAU 1676]
MFSLLNKYPYPEGLYDIVDDFIGLLNDGSNNLLYTGTNKYGTKLLGSILFEDDEELYLRYTHTLVTDVTLFDFINQRITLRDIILSSQLVFIVDRSYNNEILNKALVPLSEIPSTFLPLPESYCPPFIKQNSLEYTFSLKGALADSNKAEPLVMSNTNSIVYSLLDSATKFLPDLQITPLIYSEVALAGSFKLNFRIELKETFGLFTKSSEDIRQFLYRFLTYLFERLPNEPKDALKDVNSATDNFRKLFSEFQYLYTSRNFTTTEAISEQKVIDLITYSVDSVKRLDYKGFNRIEISNNLGNGEAIPVALINTDFYNSVSDKVFRPEDSNIVDIIKFDETDKPYRIRVYSLNRESGNGSAYFEFDNRTIKISLHLRGKGDYHGTIFTKSLDNNLYIETKGIGKWVNGILKQVTVNVSDFPT